jgi:riboflavin synthase
MFTGLAEEVGRISGIKPRGDGLTVEIQAIEILRDVKIGDSIAVDGVCLTVINANSSHFSVDAVSETVKRTTLASKKVGGSVNLERAMAANGRFGGHFVQGHVDGMGKIISIEQRPAGFWLIVEIPENISQFIIEKGSIAIDGLSLTVAAIEENIVSVAIIPHTWAVTALQGKKTSEKVNIEVDLVAKYIHKMVQPHHKKNGLTFDKLSDLGFE